MPPPRRAVGLDLKRGMRALSNQTRSVNALGEGVRYAGMTVCKSWLMVASRAELFSIVFIPMHT